MQKPQLVLSKRAKKLNKTPDLSPNVHLEHKRSSQSETKIPRSEAVSVDDTFNMRSAPPKSRPVRFADDLVSYGEPRKRALTTSTIQPALTSDSPKLGKKSPSKSKQECPSTGKSTPKSQAVQKYSMNSDTHKTTHMYFGLGVLLFLIILLGDPWFVELYDYMSNQSQPTPVALFGDIMLPTGRFHDDRYFRMDILSPPDEQIVLSPVLKCTIDGVVLTGSKGESRMFYIDAKLDGRTILFPEGNNMTVPLNGKVRTHVIERGALL